MTIEGKCTSTRGCEGLYSGRTSSPSQGDVPTNIPKASASARSKITHLTTCQACQGSTDRLPSTVAQLSRASTLTQSVKRRLAHWAPALSWSLPRSGLVRLCTRCLILYLVYHMVHILVSYSIDNGPTQTIQRNTDDHKYTDHTHHTHIAVHVQAFYNRPSLLEKMTESQINVMY